MRRTSQILLILVIGVLALFIDFWPRLRIPDASTETGSRLIETKLGLDLQGGLSVEYRVVPAGGRTPTAQDLAVVRDIIERRVNSTGVVEPVVVTQGTDRVIVELPGEQDTATVRRLVGQTGRLDFVPIPSGQTPPTENSSIDLSVLQPLFSGDQLESANVGADQNGNRTVNFVLKPAGKDLFANWTTAHIGEYFAIALDSVVISAPRINSAIPGGNVEISSGGIGGFPRKEAENLVNVLRFGSLPFPVEELSSDTISPTLGQEFFSRSLLAGLIGILLVMLFMLIHYRLPGLVAAGALIYYAMVVLAIFRLIPVTLTLAGIAGFVLSVGMAVDANILIFERTKEELRLGKSLSQAVEAGFNRAWNSILDSNVSSLITASILYFFGSSVIQGFALVLIIGVLVSMFSAITVTRNVLRLIVGRGWARRAVLYGVRDSELVSRPVARPGIAREARGV
jgi:preprotein translocase subunit SecD